MVLFIMSHGIQKFIPCHDPLLSLQRIRIGHEIKRRLPGDELLEILSPGIGNAGPVRHHQCIFKSHGADKIIGCKSLAEAGLRIPEKLPAALFEIGLRLFHRFPLFPAKHIGQALFYIYLKVSLGKFIEIIFGFLAVDVEPFRLRLAIYTLVPFQILMEIMVREAFSAAVLINSVIAPEQLDLNVCRVGLLTNPVLHLLLLCIPDFRPTLVIRNPWRGIGVNHGNNASIGLNHIHRLHLFHLLYMGFNKGDFLLIQPIFPIKLLVNLWNGL